MREKLKAAEARSKALEAERDAARARVAERDAARARVAEVEQSAGVHAAAVREDARERIAEAAHHRAALEALLAERDAELRRVRGLYVALADGGGGAEDEAEPNALPGQGQRHEPKPAQRSERGRRKPKDFDLEQFAAVVLRIGERVGLVGPAPADDDDDDEDDEA